MKNFVALIMLTIGSVSCDRVKHNADEVAKKVEEKAKHQFEKQSKRVVDKIFPPFDYATPDTENNRQRFRDFLKVEITPDVRNIYCFDDAIGIDQDYMFAFDCNASTSALIIETNDLKIDTVNTDFGFAMQHDFQWWDKKQIAKLPKYSWTNGDRYFKYYWYDEQKGKAYFFDFDM